MHTNTAPINSNLIISRLSSVLWGLQRQCGVGGWAWCFQRPLPALVVPLLRDSLILGHWHGVVPPLLSGLRMPRVQRCRCCGPVAPCSEGRARFSQSLRRVWSFGAGFGPALVCDGSVWDRDTRRDSQRHCGDTRGHCRPLTEQPLCPSEPRAGGPVCVWGWGGVGGRPSERESVCQCVCGGGVCLCVCDPL